MARNNHPLDRPHMVTTLALGGLSVGGIALIPAGGLLVPTGLFVVGLACIGILWRHWSDLVGFLGGWGWSPTLNVPLFLIVVMLVGALAALNKDALLGLASSSRDQKAGPSLNRTIVDVTRKAQSSDSQSEPSDTQVPPTDSAEPKPSLRASVESRRREVVVAEGSAYIDDASQFRIGVVAIYPGNIAKLNVGVPGRPTKIVDQVSPGDKFNAPDGSAATVSNIDYVAGRVILVVTPASKKSGG